MTAFLQKASFSSLNTEITVRAHWGILRLCLHSISTQANLNPHCCPPPPVFLKTETFFFFSSYIDTFQFCLSKKQYVMCTSVVIVEFLDIFLGFHLDGKTLQSRVAIMVFPYVFETRGGKLHTSYRGGCFTNQHQNVIL